jgi:hypothetical protein
VEDAIRAIGQTSAILLGTADPRLNPLGQQDFWLGRTWTAFGKEDPPPIPVTVLHHLMQCANIAPRPCPLLQAIADMTCLAFFFLLRPGEYMSSSSGTTPFRAMDVVLFCSQDEALDLRTCSDNDMLNTVFCMLKFPTQKNWVRGEVIGLGPSGHSLLCPCRVMARRLIHFPQCNILLTKPLATVFTGKLRPLKPATITSSLHNAILLFNLHCLGFVPGDVSAHLLQVAGAMALLCGSVNSNIIRLLGRWRSGEMLRYLHVQARPLMKDFDSKMLTGDFTFMPNHLALVPVC